MYLSIIHIQNSRYSEVSERIDQDIEQDILDILYINEDP